MRDLALGDGHVGSLAGWLLAGLVYGLAAAGLYSQATRLPVPAADQARPESQSTP